jgi:hypothetical protein
VPDQENGWSYSRDRGIYQARRMGGHIDVIGYVPGQKNGWSYTCDRGIYQARLYDHPFSWLGKYLYHVNTTTHSPGLAHTPVMRMRPPILLAW